MSNIATRTSSSVAAKYHRVIVTGWAMFGEIRLARLRSKTILAATPLARDIALIASALSVFPLIF